MLIAFLIGFGTCALISWPIFHHIINSQNHYLDRRSENEQQMWQTIIAHGKHPA